ncbi:chorismate-binding protein [Zhouia sp. PK063]|uniref:chorismate-binding protein n=1 Tax=Zhouia sp. PK063 TaxID=3373602 RepID=UPI0037AD1FA4
MMHVSFFDELLEQLQKQLPFVAYRKPNDKVVNAFFQSDDIAYEVKDFSESGFVFAPFDVNEKTYIIPAKNAIQIQEILNIEELPFKENSDKEVVLTEQKLHHQQLVKKGITTILSSSLKKVVLSRSQEIHVSIQPIEAFTKLLQNYPSACCYIWYHPKVGLWMGATPETLLNIDRNRFTTMALAGTQKYLGSLDVSWGNKEKEEQQIVTDAILNELNGKVEGIKTSGAITHKAGTLLHLKTDITGIIKNTEDIELLVKALHPTPAVCGLPKQIAKQFILENEGYSRKFYSGFFGELNLQKRIERNSNRKNVENSAYAATKNISNLYVNLRCMEVTPQTVKIYVGGGITKDSNPELEWDETVNKTATIKKALF